MTKIRAKISRRENRKTIANINKTKTWVFVKMNKIDKPTARLTKNITEQAFRQLKFKTSYVTNIKGLQENTMADYIDETDSVDEMNKFLIYTTYP